MTHQLYAEQDLRNHRFRFVVRDPYGNIVKVSGPRYLTMPGALRRGRKWMNRKGLA